MRTAHRSRRLYYKGMTITELYLAYVETRRSLHTAGQIGSGVFQLQDDLDLIVNVARKRGYTFAGDARCERCRETVHNVGPLEDGYCDECRQENEEDEAHAIEADFEDRYFRM